MKSSFKQHNNSKNKSIMDEELFNEMREAFNLFDSEQNGFIDARELKAAFKAFGFDLKKADLFRMLKNELNKDISESFTFSEFSNLLITRLTDLRESKEYMMKIFRLFDEDGIGRISFKNLKKIASDIGKNMIYLIYLKTKFEGEALSDEDLHEILEEADRDGDGMISFEEFYRYLLILFYF